LLVHRRKPDQVPAVGSHEDLVGMHGYELVGELLRRDVDDWAAVSRPHVYYSIKKLAKLDLIRPAKD
jgi:DNA-binding PadR family transcriptional regulator